MKMELFAEVLVLFVEMNLFFVEISRNLFVSAMNQGFYEFLVHIGNFYYNGFGVEKNIDIAKYYYEKAISKGYIEGIFYFRSTLPTD